MKLKQKQVEKFLSFLEDTKILYGLSSYNVKINNDIIKGVGTLARVTPDVFEKELKIELSETFLESNWNKQTSILTHELVHARVEIFNFERSECMKSSVNYLEEQLVNDLTKGFDSLIK